MRIAWYAEEVLVAWTAGALWKRKSAAVKRRSSFISTVRSINYVILSSQYLLCRFHGRDTGTDSGVVRLWDFTGAAAAAERAAAARAARSVAKFTQASSPHYQQHHHVPSQLLPPMTQLNIQQTQQQKQQRRRRSKRHEPLQQKLEAVDQLQIPANESASALEGKVVDNSRSSPAADSAAAAEPAPAARNRSRCGSGGSSSDRRRHHGNLQSSGPTFPRTRGPRPPLAPMAPAFRYLGSGVGGGNGTGGGGGGPVPSTMSTISSPSQQRPPRTQR